ncbi:MAG: DUF2256 domain-containing protein [Aureispira sp.]
MKSKKKKISKYNKSNLPEKICVACQRPFFWRKKWENCWEEVKYCSKRCQGTKGTKKDN